MHGGAAGAVLALTMIAGACDRPHPDAGDVRHPGLAAADSLRYEGRTREALTAYAALRDSFVAAGDTAHHWEAELFLADARMRVGRIDSAAAGVQVALRLAGGDPRREARTRHVWSILLDRQGKLDSALVQATRARELARGIGDRALEANTVNAIARNNSLRGRYAEALALSERELELRRSVGQGDAEIASVLNELGIGYFRLGRYEEAVAAYEEGLERYRRVDNPAGIARVLYNFSNVRTALGERERALALLRESLAITEELGDPRGLAFINNAMGGLYLEAGNREAARPHLLRSLEMNQRANLPYGEMTNRTNLAMVALADGDPSAARREGMIAMRLADSLGYGRQRVMSRVTLSAVALARRDPRGALRLAEIAVAIADSLGEPAAQYDALLARARALEALRAPDAPAAFLDAIELLESWRGRLALGDLRMGVSEPRLGAYEGAIRTLLARDMDGEAFHVAERARARLLLELMAERRRSAAARSARATVENALRERAALREAVSSAEMRRTLDAEIASLTDSLARLTAAERAAGGPGAVRAPLPASAEELRRVVLGTERAALAYFWGDSAVYGWWIDAGGVRGARLGGADSLAALIDFLRSALERPAADSQWKSPALAAYEQLVVPLAPSRTGDIIVIPDGVLAHVPFETLRVPVTAEPLGGTHRITYGPSAAVLVALAAANARPERWPRAMLAMGDPRGDGGDDGAPASRRDGALRPLPFAAREARALGDLFDDRGGADVLVGSRATVARWMRMQPARYRYVHFAAHAIVSDRQAANTALILADERLDLARIRQLPLDAELVTLSACETGLGQRVRGEGMIGLPHAFLAAGARGAVVTLWPITDRLASDFMLDFYARVRDGVPPAEALHATRQAWLAAGGERARPAHWAPFILVGGITRTTATDVADR